MDVTSLWFLLFLFVVWFFLNRASVRANRQVELLESIDRKLSVMMGEKSAPVSPPSDKLERKSAQD